MPPTPGRRREVTDLEGEAKKGAAMFGMIRNSLFGNTEKTEYKLLSSETKVRDVGPELPVTSDSSGVRLCVAQIARTLAKGAPESGSPCLTFPSSSSPPVKTPAEPLLIRAQTMFASPAVAPGVCACTKRQGAG